MNSIRLGTSSWSAKGWVGSFYPDGMKAADFLSYYATRWGCVEVDSTYYAVPRRDVVRRWASVVPDGFTMAAKFPRSIVHAGQGPRPDGPRILIGEDARRDTDQFLSAISLLGDRCGPLLLQFPYFNRQAFSSPAPFLDRLQGYLDGLPSDFRYAVEVRNRGWIGSELLDALRSRGVSIVWADLPYVPHPDAWPGDLDPVTADFAYVRLIGDRKVTDALTSTFDRIVVDRSERLRLWAKFILATSGRVEETFAFANNHFAGHGPATLEELARLLAVGGGAPPGPQLGTEKAQE